MSCHGKHFFNPSRQQPEGFIWHGGFPPLKKFSRWIFPRVWLTGLVELMRVFSGINFSLAGLGCYQSIWRGAVYFCVYFGSNPPGPNVRVTNKGLVVGIPYLKMLTILVKGRTNVKFDQTVRVFVFLDDPHGYFKDFVSYEAKVHLVDSLA